MRAEQAPREVDRDEAAAAAHAGEVEAAGVAPEPVPLDDHRGEGRSRREDAARDDDRVDASRVEARFLQEVVDGREDCETGLGSGRLQGWSMWEGAQGRGHVGLIPEPGGLGDADLVPDALLVGVQLAGVLDECGPRESAGRGRLEAGMVY
ncbi:uncharacterized protein M6B38_202690 [Iris pallida]|uniref:Uncharacterized protein n=1 Tax=Iris pallida TaxID=29817 RepID=A0AAX6EA90_IRIPA|nr:Uncharacterized protein M6B38_244350 [Iris pallida]KAJ6800986.1 uncharacterized protein M6B38_202690 [Iris pallida]